MAIEAGYKSGDGHHNYIIVSKPHTQLQPSYRMHEQHPQTDFST